MSDENVTGHESTGTADELFATEAAPDPKTPTPLVECPVCGKLGVPERIREHVCPGAR